MLPTETTAQLVVLINIPYWPGKYTIISIFQKIFTTFTESLTHHTFLDWCKQLSRHILYAGNMKQNFVMLRGSRQGNIWRRDDPHTLVIRNERDVFCTPKLTCLPFTKNSNFSYYPEVTMTAGTDPHSLFTFSL